MKDDIDLMEGLNSPLPSRASRRIAKRSKASSRGVVAVHLPGQNRPRIILFESKLEQRVLFLLLANAAVKDIREQPEPFKYAGSDGRRKHHFFDFLVVLASGRTIAVAIKPMARVRKTRFLAELEDIRAAMTSKFADDVVLITDQDFTKAEALNAERFNAFARTRNTALQRQLAELAASIRFPMTVAELQRRLGGGAECFRAIFLAIFDGVLNADMAREIDPSTIVTLGECS
ncbi:TnsA endonuclease N-terminal domain-containing protein [Leisingera sp. M523]|uniref:TnsA endonuclease N-terminal domain-containing protein n=1 Tax=Leisingera sp. M523 TaxID=2867013 RepID=UPI0021A3965C|nr:TnsA endonuclease N-terminal domain-containing protein [Leisingera sp. M523]UWQ29057.1 hypothetical protein K3557_00145 [Leisingera sp. M523]